MTIDGSNNNRDSRSRFDSNGEPITWTHALGGDSHEVATVVSPPAILGPSVRDGHLDERVARDLALQVNKLGEARRKNTIAALVIFAETGLEITSLTRARIMARQRLPLRDLEEYLAKTSKGEITVEKILKHLIANPDLDPNEKLSHIIAKHSGTLMHHYLTHRETPIDGDEARQLANTLHRIKKANPIQEEPFSFPVAADFIHGKNGHYEFDALDTREKISKFNEILSGPKRDDFLKELYAFALGHKPSKIDNNTKSLGFSSDDYDSIAKSLSEFKVNQRKLELICIKNKAQTMHEFLAWLTSPEIKNSLPQRLKVLHLFMNNMRNITQVKLIKVLEQAGLFKGLPE